VAECWILSDDRAVKNVDGEAEIPVEVGNRNFLKFIHAPLTSVSVEFLSPDTGFGKDNTRIWEGLVICISANFGGKHDFY
jgi:hypothetical protein